MISGRRGTGKTCGRYSALFWVYGTFFTRKHTPTREFGNMTMVDPAPPLFRVYAQADVRRVLRKRMKEGQLNLHAHKRTHDACYARI